MGNKQSTHRYGSVVEHDGHQSQGDIFSGSVSMVYLAEQNSAKKVSLPRIRFNPFKLDFYPFVFHSISDQLRGTKNAKIPTDTASMIVEGSRRNRRSILHWPEPEKNAEEAQMRGAISPLTLADLVNEDENDVGNFRHEKALPATPQRDADVMKELPSLPIPATWHSKRFSEGDATTSTSQTIAADVGSSASTSALPLIPCPVHSASSCLRYDCLDCNPEQRPMMFKF